MQPHHRVTVAVSFPTCLKFYHPRQLVPPTSAASAHVNSFCLPHLCPPASNLSSGVNFFHPHQFCPRASIVSAQFFRMRQLFVLESFFSPESTLPKSFNLFSSCIIFCLQRISSSSSGRPVTSVCCSRLLGIRNDGLARARKGDSLVDARSIVPHRAAKVLVGQFRLTYNLVAGVSLMLDFASIAS